MYGLYTFSLILLLAAPGQVGFEAEERGFQILVGVGLLVIGLFVIHALGSRLAKHDPQPEPAPAALTVRRTFSHSDIPRRGHTWGRGRALPCAAWLETGQPGSRHSRGVTG
jgi:hypothetical protein